MQAEIREQGLAGDSKRILGDKNEKIEFVFYSLLSYFCLQSFDKNQCKGAIS